jgi:hypothetical protein
MPNPGSISLLCTILKMAPKFPRKPETLFYRRSLDERSLCDLSVPCFRIADRVNPYLIKVRFYQKGTQKFGKSVVRGHCNHRGFVLKADLSYGAATNRFTTEPNQSKRSAPKQKRTFALHSLLLHLGGHASGKSKRRRRLLLRFLRPTFRTCSKEAS